MDEMNTESRSIFRGAWPGIELYNSVRLSWQWRRLRWAIVASSEAAQGHEANGLPPGSQEFKSLYDEAASKVKDYSSLSGEPLDTLKARLPVLCVLERLANPVSADATRNKISVAIGILVSAVLGSIGIGALIGLGTGMARLISHMFS